MRRHGFWSGSILSGGVSVRLLRRMTGRGMRWWLLGNRMVKQVNQSYNQHLSQYCTSRANRAGRPDMSAFKRSMSLSPYQLTECLLPSRNASTPLISEYFSGAGYRPCQIALRVRRRKRSSSPASSFRLMRLASLTRSWRLSSCGKVFFSGTLPYTDSHS